MKYIKDITFNMKFLTLLVLFLINPGFTKHHLQAHEIGNLEQSSLAELVDSTSPSVVTIAIKGKVKAQQNPFFDDPFFERFFDFIKFFKFICDFFHIYFLGQICINST